MGEVPAGEGPDNNGVLLLSELLLLLPSTFRARLVTIRGTVSACPRAAFDVPQTGSILSVFQNGEALFFGLQNIPRVDDAAIHLVFPAEDAGTV